MVVGTGSHKTCKASSWCSNGSSTYNWEPCAMGQGSSNDSLAVHRWGSEWKSEIPCHRSLAYNPSRNWKSLGGMWPQPPVTFGWEKQCGWEGHGLGCSSNTFSLSAIITLNLVYYYVIITLNVVYYYVIITLKVVYYYVTITLNVGILLRYYFLKCGYFKRSFFWMGIRFDYIKLGLWNKLGWIVSKLDDVQNLLFEWLAEARVATRYHHLNLGTELKKSIGMKVRSWL